MEETKETSGVMAAVVIGGSVMLIEAGLQRLDAPPWLMIGTGVLGLLGWTLRATIFASARGVIGFVAFLIAYGGLAVWILLPRTTTPAPDQVIRSSQGPTDINRPPPTTASPPFAEPKSEPPKAAAQPSPEVTKPTEEKPTPPPPRPPQPKPSPPAGTSIATPPRREPPPVVGCPPSRTDNPPHVTLQPDDLVIVGGGAAIRVDRDLKESLIASDGYLREAHGVAVGRDGQIFVTTQACLKGAVISIDPDTGTQTPIALGFHAAMGITLEPDGESLLVGDGNQQDGKWGDLVRVDLATRVQEVVSTFRANGAAQSVAVYPNPRDIYVADGPVSRIDPQGGEPIQVTVDDLKSSFALAISSLGDIFIGEHDGGTVLHVRRGNIRPLAVARYGELNDLWALAISNDGKTLFLAVGSNLGAVFKMSVPFDGKPPVPIWKGRRGGRAVVVAVVGRR